MYTKVLLIDTLLFVLCVLIYNLVNLNIMLCYNHAYNFTKTIAVIVFYLISSFFIYHLILHFYCDKTLAMSIVGSTTISSAALYFCNILKSKLLQGKIYSLKD